MPSKRQGRLGAFVVSNNPAVLQDEALRQRLEAEIMQNRRPATGAVVAQPGCCSSEPCPKPDRASY